MKKNYKPARFNNIYTNDSKFRINLINSRSVQNFILKKYGTLKINGVKTIRTIGINPPKP